jgi:hypothetical protein
VESNPIPLKAGLLLLGLGGDGVRLPLVRASVATRQRLLAALEAAGAEGAGRVPAALATAVDAARPAREGASPARAGA